MERRRTRPVSAADQEADSRRAGRPRARVTRVSIEAARRQPDAGGSSPCPRRGRAFSASGLSTTIPLAELVDRIDWSPFFHGLGAERGVSRRFSTTPGVGESARKVYDDGRRLLDRIVAEKLLRARGVVGLLAGQLDRRRHRALRATRTGPNVAGRRPHAAPADGEAAGPAERRAGGFRGAGWCGA